MKNKNLKTGEDPFAWLTPKQKEELLKETEEAFKKTTKKVFQGVFTKRKYPN